jgi:branched-chain amino acid transport system substrate-binding protein
MVLGLVLSACQPQVVEVEKEVVVTQVVREEVEVEKVVEVEVEKVVEVEKAAEDALGFVDIAPGEPVHIAYMLATSGAVEFLGADSLGGIEIAIEEYGQLHGHDILLTGEDSLCSAEGGQTAAVKVAADPTILGVLGTNCSSAGTAASVVISEAGMVMISPTNTSPALTDPNETWNPGYYRTAHNDKFQGAVAAEFAYNELGARTAAALHDGDPYTEGLASVFAEVFAEIGGTVTSFEAVNKGDTDMRPVLTTIAAGEPEVLYFPIFEPEGNFVGAQSQEVPGLENVTLMGADGLLVKSFGPNTGPAAVGMYLSGPYISDDISAYASFLAKYEANTGGPPPAGFAAHAYDGANILLASIAKAAIVDDDGTLHVGRQALRDAVGSTYRYGGLTGILSCDEYGDCATGEALAVFQLSADNVASEDNWPPPVVYTPAGGKAGSAEAAGPKEPILFHDGSWQSMWILNAIAMYVTEHGYGYPVEEITETTDVMKVGLPLGDVHVNMEGWRMNTMEWYNEQIAARNIVDLGQVFEKSTQGWYIPLYTHEEHGITTIDDLLDADVAQLFQDPEDPSKGVWTNCIVGWNCQKIMRVKATAYGMDEFYNVMEPGSAAGIDASLASAVENNMPVLSYYWEPTWVLGKYKMWQIEEPTYTKECWDAISVATESDPFGTVDEACAYSVDDIHKLVHAGLLDRAPDVAAMLSKMFVGTQMVNDLGAYMEENDASAMDTAVYYLQTFEDEWTPWVTEEAAAGIKAAVAAY